MREYVVHKIISIAAPLLVVGLILLLGLPTHDAWRVLFMVIIVYAYTHFCVGGFFQVRSYLRSEHARIKLALYCSLCLVAAGLSWLFISSPLVIFTGVFGVGYFMVHGFFNEVTLYNRQSGVFMPLSILAAVVVWLTSVAFLGLGHPSALVGSGLSFLAPHVSAIVLTYSEYAHWYELIARVAWLGVVAAFVFFIVGTVTHRQYRVSALLALIMVPITYWLIISGPPNYIVVYFILLGYHFTSWLIYYGVRYRTRKPEWNLFVKLHIALILTFLTPFLPMFAETSLMENLYNINALFAFSLIHITTSFMNEEWFKNRVMPHIWKT